MLLDGGLLIGMELKWIFFLKEEGGGGSVIWVEVSAERLLLWIEEQVELV